MKTFFFMGRNPNNQSGVSWKIWKRKGSFGLVGTGAPAQSKGLAVRNASVEGATLRIGRGGSEVRDEPDSEQAQ